MARPQIVERSEPAPKFWAELASMRLKYLPERSRAIEKLQSIRDCPEINPVTSEEADYAIDLTLNSSRRVDHYLVPNVLCDARRILGRKRVRDETRMISFDAVLP